MLPQGMIDQSSPEAAFASELRNWLTLYGQMASRAQTYVNVAYARNYLGEGNWPDEAPPAGVTAADLGAIVDLLNEFIGEVGSDDQTLINRLRVDI